MGFNSGFKGLIKYTVYTAYLAIRTVFNYSLIISFKTCAVIRFTCNRRQRRTCYSPRNLQITASQRQLVF